MSETRFRIETPGGAVEFAGSEQFVDAKYEKLPDLLALIGNSIPSTPAKSMSHPRLTRGEPRSDLSTNTMATVLGVDSGPELIIAAAAHLTMVRGEERLGRKDLAHEMKSATSFYKATYFNNLSAYLDRLVKSDRLRLVAPNTYALAATERQALDAKLANA